MRAILIYSKRGGACFVPHVALSAIFSRSALRADLKLTMTQGFSPRAKISFAPELPAGVVALNEPVEIYFDDAQILPENLQKVFNAALPAGFAINRIYFPDTNLSLGKLCYQAVYLIRSSSISPEDLRRLLLEFYADEILRLEIENDWLRLLIKNPAKNGIGLFVKKLISENLLQGWQNINIVRESIGNFHGEFVVNENGSVSID